VLALTLVGNALGTAQTTIKARPLLDDEAMGYRAAFVLDIERQGSNTRGELIVSSASDVVQVFPLDLAANARKRVYVAVPLFRSGQQVGRRTRFITPYAEWRGADGERVRLNLPLSLQARLPIVVVGDMIGGLERLNGLEVPFNSALSVLHESSSPPCKVYYLRPAALPDDWEPLLELPVIVLASGAELLSESQWRALRWWLASGGTLVVSAGAFSPQQLAALPIATQLPPQATPQEILTRRPAGKGAIYLFQGDLTQPRWREWKGLSEMFQNILLSSAFPSEQWSKRFDRDLRAPGWGTQFTGLGAGVVGLTLYGGLVWVLTARLRQRRRLASVFMPLGALTLLASATVLLFAPHARTPAPTALNLLYQSDDACSVEAQYVYATLSVGRHTLQLPEEAIVLDFRAQPPARAQLGYAGVSPVLEIQCAARTRVGLFFVRPVQSPPRLDAQLQRTTLTLRNIGDGELFSVQVLAGGLLDSRTVKLWQCVRLRPGQMVRASLNAPRSLPNLWVWAIYAVNTPTVTLDGKSVQEVGHLCVPVR
ncbi:MAG: hypothetical protein NZM28_05765, partial [Fimbriimonadales bacterium]|nr:hypothetical protein [Fimbriimonadales bacterium]